MKSSEKATYCPPSPNFYTGRGEIQATYANLPHWNRQNTAVFVTFRLFDSLPADKLRALEESKKLWLASHPEPWTNEIYREYMINFSETIQNWLDSGYGCCLLKDDCARQIVEDTIWHFAGERYALYAYVVMANHVHVLFMPQGAQTMSEIVAGWKSYSSHQINAKLGRSGAVRQKESFDTLVRSERHFETITRYIRKNDLARSWAWNAR